MRGKLTAAAKLIIWPTASRSLRRAVVGSIALTAYALLRSQVSTFAELQKIDRDSTLRTRVVVAIGKLKRTIAGNQPMLFLRLYRSRPERCFDPEVLGHGRILESRSWPHAGLCRYDHCTLDTHKIRNKRGS